MTVLSSTRVVALIRVSTAEQAADDRAGIPRQREAIRRTASSHNLQIVDTVELADVSGTSTLEAPEVQRILAQVRTRQIGGIVVADLDRLFRLKRPGDFAILDAFEETGAVIYSESGVYDFTTDEGATLGVIKGLFGGLELKAIKRRINGAREKKRRQGELGGAKVILPMGVDYDFKTKQWSYTPDVARVVEAFRLVDEDGITNISELSRRVGIKAHTLRNQLRNPIYMGWRRIDQKRGADFPQARRRNHVPNGRQRDRKKVNRASHEVINIQVIKDPAVSEERWNRVQLILSDTRNRWKREHKEEDRSINLGSGVAVCGHCGRRLYSTSGKRRSGPARPGYYHCARNHYLKKGEKCVQPNLQKAHVHQLLHTFASEHLRSEAVISALAAGLKGASSDGKHFEDVRPAMAEIDRKAERLLVALEEGALAPQTYKDRIAKLDEDRQRLQSLQERQESAAQRQEQGEEALRLLVQGCFAFARLSTEAERHAVLKQLFTEVAFTGASITSFRLQPSLPFFVSEKLNRTDTG